MDNPGTKTDTDFDVDEDTSVDYPPDYKLVLHDDNDHTYDYVIEMLCNVLQISAEKAFLHAVEVDTKKVTVLLTSCLEIVEHRQKQILQYGPDWRLKKSKGSMMATIEKI